MYAAECRAGAPAAKVSMLWQIRVRHERPAGPAAPAPTPAPVVKRAPRRCGAGKRRRVGAATAAAVAQAAGGAKQRFGSMVQWAGPGAAGLDHCLIFPESITVSTTAVAAAVAAVQSSLPPPPVKLPGLGGPGPAAAGAAQGGAGWRPDARPATNAAAGWTRGRIAGRARRWCAGYAGLPVARRLLGCE